MRILASGVVAVGLVLGHQARGEIILSDPFDRGPSPLWGNEHGSWGVADGTYDASLPSNFPNAFSSLPFVLADCSIDVDIQGVADGGVWMRAEPMPGTPIGIRGVLLVTGAGGQSLYWHIVPDGTGYGGIINPVSGLFTTGETIHLRVEVVGDTYSAYVNGSPTPATTVSTAQFASGRVALYDYSGQRFDNVLVVAPQLCVADLDGDGFVGPADLATLLGAWGTAGSADLDGDGDIGASDLAILLGQWGEC